MLRLWLATMLAAMTVNGSGLEPGTIVRTAAAEKLTVRKLKPGQVVGLQVARPVYQCGLAMIPAGSRVSLVVDHLEPVKGPSFGRKAAAFFGVLRSAPTPMPRIIPRSAELAIEGKSPVPVEVVVEEVFRARPSRKPGKPTASSDVWALSLRRPLNLAGVPAQGAATVGPVLIPAGTQARIQLEEGMDAAVAREGATVRARLSEPVMVDGRLALPAGLLVEGRVTRVAAPRRLRRPATMAFNFQRLRVGTGLDISAALSSAETDTVTGIDREGAVTAKRPLGRMLLDTGIAYVAGKVVDDLIEEGVKGIWGATAAGSGATAARYVGLGVGLGFFLAQRGADVRLPRFAELEIAFTRPFAADPNANGCAATP